MEQNYVTVTLYIHAYKHSITRAIVVKSARLLESTRKELTNSVHVQLILVVCVAWRPRNQVSVGNESVPIQLAQCRFPSHFQC